MKVGIGYRPEMKDWNLDFVDFVEVIAENWVDRRLDTLLALNKPVHFHGVSLSLGSNRPFDGEYLKSLGRLLEEFPGAVFSDHLASSGDAHTLHDLFPVPFTKQGALHLVNRIDQIQNFLKRPIGVENIPYYSNTGDMWELEWLDFIVEASGCMLHLDTNNLWTNWLNHGHLPLLRMQEGKNDAYNTLLTRNHTGYCHVAACEWNNQFKMYQDTHAGWPTRSTLLLARLAKRDILLEWDHDIPTEEQMREEICRIRRFSRS